MGWIVAFLIVAFAVFDATGVIDLGIIELISTTLVDFIRLVR